MSWWPLLWWSASALAGDDWVIRHFSTADGLPVSSARAARVDLDGFLWLATHDGLARFDGQRFEVFDKAGNPAMDSNRIVDLYVDDLGRLYALTQPGTLLRVRANQIERVDPDPTQPAAPIRHLVDTPFCATLASGLYCHDEQGQFQRHAEFGADLDINQALPAAEDSAWLIGENPEIWWQAQNGRSIRIDSGSMEAIPSSAQPLALTDAQ